MKGPILNTQRAIFLAAVITSCTCYGGSGRQRVAILNGADVESTTITAISTFIQKELSIGLRTGTTKAKSYKDLNSATDSISKMKRKGDACIIAFVQADDQSLHARYDTNRQVAVINTSVLKAENNDIYRKRLERQAMRSIAFLFGIEPAPDPYCVTRHYKDIKDLDQMGRNFTPPSQVEFRKKAEKRGLLINEP